jgi:tetratricopeptide (TPR) repeat protein
MLFDLRGRGRRRTVQVIYVSLAILMGGGLVLFGIGGNTNGGLVDAITGGGGGGSSIDDAAQKDVKQAVAATQSTPQDPAAWLRLTKARYQLANVVGYDRNTGGYDKAGQAELRRADTAWERYIALDPKTPDVNLASLMVQAYGPDGLNQLGKAVTAQELITEAKPKDYAAYAQLALLAYEAKQLRKGDLASKKALELAPKNQRDQLNQTLRQAKANPAIQQLQKDAQGTSTTGTTTTGK